MDVVLHDKVLFVGDFAFVEFFTTVIQLFRC